MNVPVAINSPKESFERRPGVSGSSFFILDTTKSKPFGESRLVCVLDEAFSDRGGLLGAPASVE